jgi:hypothetical protein
MPINPTATSHRIEMCMLAILVLYWLKKHVSAWACLIRSDYNFVFIAFAYFVFVSSREHLVTTVVLEGVYAGVWNCSGISCSWHTVLCVRTTNMDDRRRQQYYMEQFKVNAWLRYLPLSHRLHSQSIILNPFSYHFCTSCGTTADKLRSS